MKVAANLLLTSAATINTAVAASNQRTLRGNHQNDLSNTIEDVAFWANLHRHMQYMSMPNYPNNEELTLNSVELSTSLAPSINETGSPTPAPVDSTSDVNVDAVSSVPTPAPNTQTKSPATPSNNITSSPTTFEATPFPTQLHERTSLKQFTCPSPTFVGCTDPNPVHPSNECDIVGELCGEDMYCCQDDCPRNYCTGKSG
ncbi:hypothetical protein ACHAWO_009827 [Cyclotella atomus]|uniref:WAP domain-containing protein n=1 Tax=Cyclotella atomus TaxID=382360 RepID=A0ABD3QJB8_9STRA